MNNNIYKNIQVNDIKNIQIKPTKTLSAKPLQNINISLDKDNYNTIFKKNNEIEVVNFNDGINIADTTYSNNNVDTTLLEKTGATIIVAGIKIVNSLLNVFEGMTDGIKEMDLFLTGMINSLIIKMYSGNEKERLLKSIENNEKEYKNSIATENINNLENNFFNTEMGGSINEYSYMKYDSNFANKMSDISKEIGEFLVATFATVETGGIASPIILGYLSGTGEKAEDVYSKTIETTRAEEAGIFFFGLAEATSWVAKGRLGQSAMETVSIVKDIASNYSSYISDSWSSDSVLEAVKNLWSTQRKRDLGISTKNAFLNALTEHSKENIADVANGVFTTIEHSLDKDVTLSKKTFSEIGEGLVVNTVTNTVFNGFEILNRSFRTCGVLDDKVISLIISLKDIADSAEDSGVGFVGNGIDYIKERNDK